MAFWTPERRRFHALFPAIGNKKLGTAIQFYHMALAHGFSPVGAQYLVDHAWMESEFDPHSQPDHGIHQVGANVDNLSPAGQFQWYMDHMRPGMRNIINNSTSVMDAFASVRRYPGWETGSANRWINAENSGAFPIQQSGAQPTTPEIPQQSPAPQMTEAPSDSEPTPTPLPASPTPTSTPSATPSFTDLQPSPTSTPNPEASQLPQNFQASQPDFTGYEMPTASPEGILPPGFQGSQPDFTGYGQQPVSEQDYYNANYPTGEAPTDYGSSLMQSPPDFSVPDAGITPPMSSAMTFGDYQSPSAFIPQNVNFQGDQFDTSQMPYAPVTAPGELPNPVPNEDSQFGIDTYQNYQPNDQGQYSYDPSFQGPGEMPNEQSQSGYDPSYQSGPSNQTIYDPYASPFLGGFDPSYQSPDFSSDPVISPGVSSPFSDAMMLPGSTSVGSFDPGSLEGTAWSGASAAGLSDTGFGNLLYHQYLNAGVPNVSFIPVWGQPAGFASAPGAGQENLGLGPGHITQLNPR